MWRRPLINELSAQRKFKKLCCGKCSRLALLIKVGVFQELITSAFQKEFAELRNSGTDQHGLPLLQTEKLQEKLIFFPFIDMQDIVVA